MECFFKEKAILYFYKELTEKENIELREHISICPDCRREIEELEKIGNFLNLKIRFPEFLENKIISYSISKLYDTNYLSLPDKIFSFAFSFAVIIFFFIPIVKSPGENHIANIENRLLSLENNLLAFKNEFMDTSDYDFEYNLSNIDYADMEKEIIKEVV